MGFSGWFGKYIGIGIGFSESCIVIVTCYLVIKLSQVRIVRIALMITVKLISKLIALSFNKLITIG